MAGLKYTADLEEGIPDLRIEIGIGNEISDFWMRDSNLRFRDSGSKVAPKTLRVEILKNPEIFHIDFSKKISFFHFVIFHPFDPCS